MTKRIGILTLHRALNFGAVFQCYALKHACEAMDYEVETIDYNPFGHYSVLGALHHRPIVAYKYIMFMRQFNRFVSQYLNPTTHTESHEWIKNNPPQDDIYIVGSDTVWSNAVVGDYLDSYLLDFAPPQVKRISFAASTGGNPMTLNEYQLTELRKFAAISVRERQSVSDVQAKVDIPVVDVCDPTLLLTQYDYAKIEQKPLWLPKHYIVYFDLAGDPFCSQTAQLIAKSLHLPILNLVGKYRSWAQYNYLTPTPEQWLYILHHADFVCTNSFHGVAFSIIFRRLFICCTAKKGGRAKTNGRMLNLLEKTNLQERYVTDFTQVTETVVEDMDFVDSESYIYKYIEYSLEWLKNAISDEKNQER